MAFERLGIPAGASVLDVGTGTGWSSHFLAEAGYRPLGVDIAPGNVEIASAVAERWGSAARFAVADMESLDLGGELRRGACLRRAPPHRAAGRGGRRHRPSPGPGWLGPLRRAVVAPRDLSRRPPRHARKGMGREGHPRVGAQARLPRGRPRRASAASTRARGRTRDGSGRSAGSWPGSWAPTCGSRPAPTSGSPRRSPAEPVASRGTPSGRASRRRPRRPCRRPEADWCRRRTRPRR